MRLGYYPFERLHGQEVLVSVSVNFDRKNKKSDILQETIDYIKVIEFIDHTLKDSEIKLLEKAVEVLGQNFLEEYRTVKSISIKIDKPIIPGGRVKGASVSASEIFTRGLNAKTSEKYDKDPLNYK
jgi:FolB domain-containing protein